MRSTNVVKTGRKFLKGICVLVVSLILLSGCTKEETLDWLIGDFHKEDYWSETLCNDYLISRTSSQSISLCKQEGEFLETIISGFCVTEYLVDEPYIYLMGIKGKGLWVTQEEIEGNLPVYYFVDTEDGRVRGPFNTYEDLQERCIKLDISISGEWVTVPG